MISGPHKVRARACVCVRCYFCCGYAFWYYLMYCGGKVGVEDVIVGVMDVVDVYLVA